MMSATSKILVRSTRAALQRTAIARQTAVLRAMTTIPTNNQPQQQQHPENHWEQLHHQIDHSVEKLQDNLASLDKKQQQQEQQAGGNKVHYEPVMGPISEHTKFDKEAMLHELEDLKVLQEQVRVAEQSASHVPFAVDAPDGESDAHLEEELEIDYNILTQGGKGGDRQ